jgi:UDP-GlcNAc3NAcA epimerase
MKILTIIGARPQFVKASAVSRAIKGFEGVDEIIIHTGQHFDANMSKVFFDEMHIPEPQYNLNINGLSHGAMTGQMVEKIEEILLFERPDWVLVYGDTNSTLAGALAATKLHIKIAHIEAGLRSFNMNMPEEINRVLTDRISDILFCPTSAALNNLSKEGYPNTASTGSKQIMLNIGDVMQDSALYYKDFAIRPDIELSDDYILTTIHRAENTDNKENLTGILNALNHLAKTKQIVIPLHPRTKAVIDNGFHLDENILIIDPVGYLEMIFLIMNCSLVMTDSGGLQKEAFFFKKPCITLREETEWVELVDLKFNVLVGSNEAEILKAFDKFDFNSDYSHDLYGSGYASKNIISHLVNV